MSLIVDPRESQLKHAFERMQNKREKLPKHSHSLLEECNAMQTNCIFYFAHSIICILKESIVHDNKWSAQNHMCPSVMLTSKIHPTDGNKVEYEEHPKVLTTPLQLKALF